MKRQPFSRDVLEEMHGRCGHCRIEVDNHDANHLVTPILEGGRGVECVLRGDVHPSEAGPLRKVLVPITEPDAEEGEKATCTTCGGTGEVRSVIVEERRFSKDVERGHFTEPCPDCRQGASE